MALICSAWLGATCTITAQPEAKELKGAITFDHAVEVPGVVLPAGTYVIRVKGPAPDNTPPGSNLVEFLSQDESRIYATVRTAREYRPSPAGKPLYTFYEDADGQQLALKAWWPPANSQPYQERFIYPTARALELMRAVSDAALHPHPKIPRSAGKPSGVLPSVTSGRSRATPARAPEDMPKTASDLPLLLLTGLLWCLAGFAIRAFSILAAQKATYCTVSAIPPALGRSGHPLVRQALTSIVSGAPFSLRIVYRRTQPR